MGTHHHPGLQDHSNPTWVLLGAGFVTLLLYSISRVIYNLYFHPLTKYPGPKSMAATDIPYIQLLLGGRYPQSIKDLHRKYGEVVRIAPNELSFINGKTWKVIYGTRPGHGQKPKDRRFLPPTPKGAPSIIASNNEDHSRFRRLLSHGFSDSSLRGQESTIKAYVDLLMQRLRENCDGGKRAIDLVKWYNFTTFDIIGDLTFGESFHCLKTSEYHESVNTIISYFKNGVYANVARRLTGSMSLLKLITPKKVTVRRDRLVASTIEKVNARLRRTDQRPDFFGNILKHENTEKGFSFPELVSNSNTLIIAGSETTATLLSGATYLLLTNPRVLQKLQDEIRSTFTNESQINLEACNNLTYCLAVLTEALRVYPPVAPGVPRVVDEQGDTIDGNWIPGGTVVSISQLAANHSPINFTDPDKFIPERHLGDPRFANDKKDAMQPFSFGPRNCIGRNLAIFEMRMILARMIFNFDMQLDQPEQNWMDQESFIFWEKSPLPVRLTPRTVQA